MAILAGSCGSKHALRLATTTSVDNSGLLEPLLREFQSSTGVGVEAIAVGSGKAMELVRRGDADLMITHDPVGERTFLDAESPLLYRKMMCGRFILAGPRDDPAGVADADSAAEAMAKIARSGSRFASRGDRSGTHARELQLWQAAEAHSEPANLLESGQGMAATLRIASERDAYVLTDEATFAQLRDSLDLVPLLERDAALLNCYAVTVVAGSNQDQALRLADWLSRGDGRDMIESFEIGGKRLFDVWPEGVPDDRPESLPK